ncbi:conjugal transfer pilus assembly protein TraW [Rodentibacter sp. JRC1]|uniref:type-F conjugative transfer system protein TraW n=1 Tax=Rodentibacter sp. JRC1 TaxID=2874504 RepID=UPI001CFC8701|nr:type-F conjugative transfer system protein TraW [Rodentibacter sp. JRC1]GJI56960.1 conjugal transfer pilus assembly protein TraW [Rodentibacter sp. JRC1]
MKKYGLLPLIFLSLSVSAKDLGKIGDVWAIQEQNLLSLIDELLKAEFEGKSEAEIQEEVKKRVTENALRPPPVILPVAKVDSMRSFDPSYTVERDLADHKGQVFAHKGQVVNPFDTVPFARTLVFIDGDDEKQIEWLKSFKPETEIVKIILLNGDLREATEKLDVDLYFDQNGALVNRFGIKAVPSVIDEMPGKKLLRIREFGLK